jgi:hypothetical protein
MIDIKVRYNTQCDDNHTFWRILIDGKEHTCSNVIFEIPTHTTKDIVWDSLRKQEVEKHHMSCLATEVLWKGDVVIIK